MADLPNLVFARDMQSAEAVASMLDHMASQVNCCSVAMQDLGVGGAPVDSNSDCGRLLSAFCDLVAVRDNLAKAKGA